MPQHKSAAKRVRQDAKRRLRNRNHKVKVRTMIKALEAETEQEAAQLKLNEIKAHLDRLAGRRVLHPNQASNTKSRLDRHVQSLS